MYDFPGARRETSMDAYGVCILRGSADVEIFLENFIRCKYKNLHSHQTNRLQQAFVR